MITGRTGPSCHAPPGTLGAQKSAPRRSAAAAVQKRKAKLPVSPLGSGAASRKS